MKFDFYYNMDVFFRHWNFKFQETKHEFRQERKGYNFNIKKVLYSMWAAAATIAFELLTKSMVFFSESVSKKIMLASTYYRTKFGESFYIK